LFFFDGGKEAVSVLFTFFVPTCEEVTEPGTVLATEHHHTIADIVLYSLESKAFIVDASIPLRLGTFFL